jgi:hypothetical protein
MAGCTLTSSPGAFGQGQVGTAAEAKAMLERAVIELKTDEVAALAKFNNANGGFRGRDLYVYCCVDAQDADKRQLCPILRDCRKGGADSQHEGSRNLSIKKLTRHAVTGRGWSSAEKSTSDRRSFSRSEHRSNSGPVTWSPTVSSPRVGALLVRNSFDDLVGAGERSKVEP